MSDRRIESDEDDEGISHVFLGDRFLGWVEEVVIIRDLRTPDGPYWMAHDRNDRPIAKFDGSGARERAIEAVHENDEKKRSRK